MILLYYNSIVKSTTYKMQDQPQGPATALPTEENVLRTSKNKNDLIYIYYVTKEESYNQKQNLINI